MIDPIILQTGFDSLGSVLDLWHSFYGFIIFAVGLLMGIGFMSRTMVLSAWGAYVGFAFLAIEIDDTLMESILIVTLVLIFVGWAFKLWRAEGLGGGGS